MWDMAMVQIVPGLHLAAPRDATRLREELREAVAIEDAPSVIRYSKGSVGAEVEAVERLDDGVDVLARRPAGSSENDVLIVSVGAMSELALDVSNRLGAQGISSTVVDPRWVLPVRRSIIDLAARHRLVICIEDGVRAGGVGSRIRQEMRAAGVDTALNEVGLPGRVPRSRHPQPGARTRRADRPADHARRRRPGPGHQGAVCAPLARPGTPQHRQPAAAVASTSVEHYPCGATHSGAGRPRKELAYEWNYPGLQA